MLEKSGIVKKHWKQDVSTEAYLQTQYLAVLYIAAHIPRNYSGSI